MPPSSSLAPLVAVQGGEFDHFYVERKDLTEAVVEYPMGSNYRTVGSLPTPIWVVGEEAYELPEGKSGCVLVVTSRCVNAVCKGGSCVSLTDFEDLIVPVALASLEHEDVSSVQNIVDKILQVRELNMHNQGVFVAVASFDTISNLKTSPPPLLLLAFFDHIAARARGDAKH